jgi:hypothetical protein
MVAHPLGPHYLFDRKGLYHNRMQPLKIGGIKNAETNYTEIIINLACKM